MTDPFQGEEAAVGVPPRVFEMQGSSPYRTASQAYPHHREEAQEVLNEEVSEEELWQPPAGAGDFPLHGPGSVDLDEPETTLGEGISIKGELRFQRYLRVDGEFEGELISDGKIVVGPAGVVRANINLREAIIEGTVEGDITVSERLELRGDAKVHGNIAAKLLSIDEGVTILGQLNVKPASSTLSDD